MIYNLNMNLNQNGFKGKYLSLLFTSYEEEPTIFNIQHKMIYVFEGNNQEYYKTGSIPKEIFPDSNELHKKSIRKFLLEECEPDEDGNINIESNIEKMIPDYFLSMLGIIKSNKIQLDILCNSTMEILHFVQGNEEEN